MNTMNESYDQPCALVTGATSGIGAAFASRLARKGYNLILHGRRQKELTERAGNLEESCHISVEIMIAELSLAEEMKIGAYFNMVAMENYGATKAYILSFTESLHVALMGTGIRVPALVPGFTVTEFHSRLGADFTEDQRRWMQPEKVVDKSLRVLEKGHILCFPGFKQRFIVMLANFLPRRVYYKIMKVMGDKIKKRWDDIEKA